MPEQIRFTPPALVLLAVNFIPVFGVLLWGWSLLEIVALYWLENVIIGAVNVLKMMTCVPDLGFLQMDEAGNSPKTDEVRKPPRVPPDAGSFSQIHWGALFDAKHQQAISHHFAKLFMVPFFAFHYGFFCFVHGVFIFALLGGKRGLGVHQGPLFEVGDAAWDLLRDGTWGAALALAGSHFFSYCYYFLYQGEFRKTNIAILMAAPYGRVVVLHVAILFGAFATFMLGQPMIMVILLIVGKTMLDWTMHTRSHQLAPAAVRS